MALGKAFAAITLSVTCAATAWPQVLFVAPPSGTQKPDELRTALGLGPAPDSDAVERGRQLFHTACAFCHGSNATGGNGGPNLVRSVLILHDAGSGKALGAVLREGRIARGMPQFALAENQIADLAAFLLQRTQATADRFRYTVLNVVTGDAAKGFAYFNIGCASCHSATGDLAHIATKFEPVALQSRFLYPDDSHNDAAPTRKPVSSVAVTLPSGEVIRGGLLFQDDFRVTVLDSTGKTRVIDFEAAKHYDVVVHDALKGHELLLKKYTDADMHNVLAYLETLK